MAISESEMKHLVEAFLSEKSFSVASAHSLVGFYKAKLISFSPSKMYECDFCERTFIKYSIYYLHSLTCSSRCYKTYLCSVSVFENNYKMCVMRVNIRLIINIYCFSWFWNGHVMGSHWAQIQLRIINLKPFINFTYYVKMILSINFFILPCFKIITLEHWKIIFSNQIYK